jgi:hypothetical protein
VQDGLLSNFAMLRKLVHQQITLFAWRPYDDEEGILEILAYTIKGRQKSDGGKIEITEETGLVIDTMEFRSLLD